MKKSKLLSAFAALLCFASLASSASAAVITVIDTQVVADGTTPTAAGIRSSVYEDDVTVNSTPGVVTYMAVLRLFDDGPGGGDLQIGSIFKLDGVISNGDGSPYSQPYDGSFNFNNGNPDFRAQDLAGNDLGAVGSILGPLPQGTFSVTFQHSVNAGFKDPMTGNPQTVTFTAQLAPTGVGAPATAAVMDTSTVTLVPEPSVATTLGLLGFLGIFRRRNRRA